MTVLNFYLHESVVCVVTDTLGVHLEDKSPLRLTMKAYPVPHWQGLICGIGPMQFIVGWYCRAITSILAKGIRHLDKFTPDILREMFEEYEQCGSRETTSTIYHFGFDHDAGRFIGFAYRSAEGFVSEELEYGAWIHPALGDGSGGMKSVPDSLISIAKEQKLRDDTLLTHDRVGLGGHLISYLMVRFERDDGTYGVRTEIDRCHEFPDYEEAYLQACMKLPDNQSL